MKPELPTQYHPSEVEESIYRKWESSGFFDPDKLPSGRFGNSKLDIRNFCIVMPPPNANGALHIGHALFVTLQDIMIRYKRMRGFKTLWLPGADHAGFETQGGFDKKLEKEGRNRFEIPRDQLYQEMLDFTLENKKVMENQLKKLGASCDWSREKFTLDPDIIEVVYGTFQKLYEDGLIYRDLKVVNWCTKHQTALSDLEVKYKEKEDTLYYISYGPLVLATVRPETKFGDTALAVNPRDGRYQKYVSKEIEARGLLGPLKFKVIADDAVDPGFGTGVVKVTPAHDAADFGIWQRHKDEIPGPRIIIDERGRLTKETGPYQGLKVAEAREKVAEDMKKIGILEKVESNYTHQVATCYKCGTILEPLPRQQWFIAMTKSSQMKNEKFPPDFASVKSRRAGKVKNSGKSLRDLAVEAVRSGKIKFIPKRFEKIFFHWMKDLRDWNISRQIVWGIRIPAWFHEPVCIPRPGREKDVKKCKPLVISKEKPICQFCDAGYFQDPDVFDTWFSSGQWPFATLVASGHKSRESEKLKVKSEKLQNDFDRFYPTDVMETGWDILFFWVARMIILGLYRTGKAPFKTVYLHGLVRDKDRQKMSKSKGNVVDPLGVAEVYGTDAVRMALVVGSAAGNDPVISEDKIRGYRNFSNKIWNASRFLAMHLGHLPDNKKVRYDGKYKAMLKKLSRIEKEVTHDLEVFRFHHAAEKLYHFFWHYYADKVIENIKKDIVSDDDKKEKAISLLVEFHERLMKLLHPFMPFVTEYVWQEVLGKKTLLMVEPWPK